MATASARTWCTRPARPTRCSTARCLPAPGSICQSSSRRAPPSQRPSTRSRTRHPWCSASPAAPTKVRGCQLIVFVTAVVQQATRRSIARALATLCCTSSDTTLGQRRLKSVLLSFTNVDELVLLLTGAGRLVAVSTSAVDLLITERIAADLRAAAWHWFQHARAHWPAKLPARPHCLLCHGANHDRQRVLSLSCLQLSYVPCALGRYVALDFSCAVCTAGKFSDFANAGSCT